MPGPYRWDDDALRFRDARSRFVAPETVRSAVDALADYAAGRLQELARRLASGEVDIQEFHESARSIIKNAHVAAAAIAAGGRDRMGASENGRAGSRIKQEYGYLYELARKIERGEFTLDGLVAKARMYGESAVAAFEFARRAKMRAAGFSEEMRVLGGSNHCDPCIDHASRRWQPIGTLPDISDECDCKTNCHCTFVYRKRTRAAG